MKFTLIFALMIVSASSFASSLLCKSATSKDLKITFQPENKILVESGSVKFYGTQTHTSHTRVNTVTDYNLSGGRGSAKMKLISELVTNPEPCRSPRACAGDRFIFKYTMELDYVGLHYFECN